ncbi:hypothetical protein OEG84_01825 [Hoeflea sp. G2-23]|uniref:Integrase n=1 Tax=Hoeflea algicola TaxID=2983763 RepID=A0ABT3Z3Z5_9HYPH|nr:hypothetical protein [Hoeflea algicola]MCY0146488.1 hypothetical protein [Hoeflea algicola]
MTGLFVFRQGVPHAPHTAPDFLREDAHAMLKKRNRNPAQWSRQTVPHGSMTPTAKVDQQIQWQWRVITLSTVKTNASAANRIWGPVSDRRRFGVSPLTFRQYQTLVKRQEWRAWVSTDGDPKQKLLIIIRK